MISVSMGSSGPLISELKELLDLIGDPAKAKKVLADIDKNSLALNDLIKKSSLADQSLKAKIDSIAVKEKDISDSLQMIDVKNKANADLLIELESKQLAINSKIESLDLGLKKLEKDKLAFDLMVKSKSSELDSKLSLVDKSLSDSQAVKDEYESKLSKLKAVVG